LNFLFSPKGNKYLSSHGVAYYSDFYEMQIPDNYCPGHEGRMDWGKGPGTMFQEQILKDIKRG